MAQSLIFVTGNATKFKLASHALKPYGINLEQTVTEIDEIQGEDGEAITRDKAKKAFAAVGKPLIVCDSNWFIMGLNGFPGPYMKSVSHWFTPQNWLDLTGPLKDRSVILREYVVFTDMMETVTLSVDVYGKLLTQAKGRGGVSFDRVVSLSDDGVSIAERLDGKTGLDYGIQKNIWQVFGEWYKEHRLA